MREGSFSGGELFPKCQGLHVLSLPEQKKHMKEVCLKVATKPPSLCLLGLLAMQRGRSWLSRSSVYTVACISYGAQVLAEG